MCILCLIGIKSDLSVELYDSTKYGFCEYEKGSVCGKVAKSSIISIFEFNLIIAMKMIKLILTNDEISDILIIDENIVMRGLYA